MSAEVEWRQAPDGRQLALLDERVAVALSDENAYWRTPEHRRRAIEQRCHDAEARECDNCARCRAGQRCRNGR